MFAFNSIPSSDSRESGGIHPPKAGASLPGLAADQVEMLPNGGVCAVDDDGRLWVGDSAAADDEGWIPLQHAD